MFEGVYFQFPKLGFLLFFFLACEALCPLRTNPVYFPHLRLFGSVGVKSPLWLWIAKWSMISLLIVALMSPVREHPVLSGDGGDDIVIAIDPRSIDSQTLQELRRFVALRHNDRIGIWVPAQSSVRIPMSREYDVLTSMIAQLHPGEMYESLSRNIEAFFSDSQENSKWMLLISNRPETFVHSLPEGVGVSAVLPEYDHSWSERIDREHPEMRIEHRHKYFEFYYLYPLFGAFLAMLAYLYGRNQKGIR